MKCGKTSLASQFDEALICSFEQGSNALNQVYIQPTKTWNEWKQILSQLTRKNELKEKFHTIVIDTVDQAWDACVTYVCSQNGVERLGDLPYGQGYDLAKKEFSSGIRDLTFAGYGLVFISHSMEKTYTDEKGDEYTKIVPALPNRPFEIVNKLVDIIAYIREIPIEENGEVVRKRYMFFRGNDRFLAGSRFHYMQDKAELSYEALVDAIYSAIDKEVANTGGTTTEDANPYTVQDFDSLMDEAKALWGMAIQKDKVKEVSTVLEKEFGRPIKFSEILPEQIEELKAVLLEIKNIV